MRLAGATKLDLFKALILKNTINSSFMDSIFFFIIGVKMIVKDWNPPDPMKISVIKPTRTNVVEPHPPVTNFQPPPPRPSTAVGVAQSHPAQSQRPHPAVSAYRGHQ